MTTSVAPCTLWGRGCPVHTRTHTRAEQMQGDGLQRSCCVLRLGAAPEGHPSMLCFPRVGERRKNSAVARLSVKQLKYFLKNKINREKQVYVKPSPVQFLGRALSACDT